LRRSFWSAGSPGFSLARFFIPLVGVVTLLVGILIWTEWPASGLWMIGTFVAIDMVFSGTRLIMLALNARCLPSSGTHP
jgi:uncharacterized membrane protein HdeD (DUF308 family)